MTKVGCPKCKNLVDIPFGYYCPNCDFNIDALTGKTTSSFQAIKWNEHTDILQGRDIELYGKEFNASFDYNGFTKLEDLIRFTITYGDRGKIQSQRGNNENDIIVGFIPEIIGSGTAIYVNSEVPCSGVVIISPQSEMYAHSFPAIDQWINNKFLGHIGCCKLCGKEMPFGHTICNECYEKYNNWLKLI